MINHNYISSTYQSYFIKLILLLLDFRLSYNLLYFYIYFIIKDYSSIYIRKKVSFRIKFYNTSCNFKL